MARKKRKYTRRVVPAVVEQPPLCICWRPHEEGFFRVWRNDWHGDVFEVMTTSQFESVRYVCARFNIQFFEATDED